MNIKKIVYILLVFVCLTGIGFSGVQIVSQMKEYRDGEQAYEAVEQYVQFPGGETEAGSGTSDGAMTDSEDGAAGSGFSGQCPEVDFAALRSVNEDTVGWIYGEGTGISYPVVQGTDNDYYLTHLFSKTVNSSGSIFLDAGSPADFSAKNTVIYGHHMKNGTMFSALKNYEDQDYCETHPFFWIVTPDKNYKLEVISAYVADVKQPAWRTNFASEEDFRAWLQEIQERSSWKSSRQPNAEDRVVTLSTCSYEFDDARFVVHGVLKEEIGL